MHFDARGSIQKTILKNLRVLTTLELNLFYSNTQRDFSTVKVKYLRTATTLPLLLTQ